MQAWNPGILYYERRQVGRYMFAFLAGSNVVDIYSE